MTAVWSTNNTKSIVGKSRKLSDVSILPCNANFGPQSNFCSFAVLKRSAEVGMVGKEAVVLSCHQNMQHTQLHTVKLQCIVAHTVIH